MSEMLIDHFHARRLPVKWLRPLQHVPLRGRGFRPEGFLLAEVEFFDKHQQMYRIDLTYSRTSDEYMVDLKKGLRRIDAHIRHTHWARLCRSLDPRNASGD
jgi:hypothetical protein